jgi:hypothetical protein
MQLYTYSEDPGKKIVKSMWWCLSFQTMSAAVGKTPVSVLQELLSRRGTTPKYELVQIEGAIHEPTFRYRVTVADVVGMYEDERARLYCTILLRILLFKFVL